LTQSRTICSQYYCLFDCNNFVSEFIHPCLITAISILNAFNLEIIIYLIKFYSINTYQSQTYFNSIRQVQNRKTCVCLNKINCWTSISDNLLGTVVNCSNLKTKISLNVIINYRTRNTIHKAHKSESSWNLI